MRHATKRMSLLIALAAACAGAPGADWPEVPLPEGATAEWVSRHMIYNGLHMRASRFASGLSPEQVKAFYRARWNGKLVENDVDGRTVLGHQAGDHFVTVEIWRAGAGSEGNIGITRLLKEMPRRALGEGFPQPAGSRVISDIEYLDTEGRTIVIQSTLTPRQGMDFYRRRLEALGWQPAGESTCPIGAVSCVAQFQGPKGRLMLTFDYDRNGTSIVGNQTK